MHRAFLSLVLFMASFSATAGTDVNGYNEYTIRPADFPRDALRFENYPAQLYKGKSSVPDIQSHPSSRMFRTRILEWAREKPNFAGHYVLATWGCGTDCVQITIIDVIDGKVYHPPGVGSVESVNVHDDLLESRDIPVTGYGTGSLRYRSDSKLLVLIGTPEGRTKERGISFYLWRENKLKKVRSIKKGWYE